MNMSGIVAVRHPHSSSYLYQLLLFRNILQLMASCDLHTALVLFHCSRHMAYLEQLPSVLL